MDLVQNGFLRNLSLLQYGSPLTINSCGKCSSPQIRKRICSSSSFVKRFDTEHRLQAHRGCVNCINFSHEGDRLVSGSDDLKIVVWDWRKGEKVMAFQSHHQANVFQVCELQVKLFFFSIYTCIFKAGSSSRAGMVSAISTFGTL